MRVRVIGLIIVGLFIATACRVETVLPTLVITTNSETAKGWSYSPAGDLWTFTFDVKVVAGKEWVNPIYPTTMAFTVNTTGNITIGTCVVRAKYGQGWYNVSDVVTNDGSNIFPFNNLKQMELNYWFGINPNETRTYHLACNVTAADNNATLQADLNYLVADQETNIAAYAQGKVITFGWNSAPVVHLNQNSGTKQEWSPLSDDLWVLTFNANFTASQGYTSPIFADSMGFEITTTGNITIDACAVRIKVNEQGGWNTISEVVPNDGSNFFQFNNLQHRYLDYYYGFFKDETKTYHLTCNVSSAERSATLLAHLRSFSTDVETKTYYFPSGKTIFFYYN